MIKAEHLRLGNIYNRKHGKGYTAIVMTEEIISKIFGNSPEHALDDFENIELTDDLVDNCIFPEYSHFEIIYSTKLPGRHVYWFQNKRRTWACQVTYLHQLQNLWASLHQHKTHYNSTMAEMQFKQPIAI